MQRIRMLASVVAMPGNVLYEDGRIYDVDPAVAVEWIAAGLAASDGSELAAIQPPEQAIQQPAQRRRKGS
jgi:hypothetical protein